MRMFWIALIAPVLVLAATSCLEGPAAQEFPTSSLSQSPTAGPATVNTMLAVTPSAAGGPITTPESTPLPTPAPDPAAVNTRVVLTPTSLSGQARQSLAPLRPLDLEPAFPNLEPLDGLVGMVSPDDGTDRLFQVLQPGRIFVHTDNREVAAAGLFLDIRDRVNDRGNEEGLLGLAFDPGFGENGYFYVYYSAANPRRSVISRFSTDPINPAAADVDSETIVMEVRQPFRNHNGGQLAFGPDGFLYIGLGDGGRGGDPQENGQDLSTLLGSVLRIDVSAIDQAGSYTVPADNPFVGVQGARSEIWAYGLRNPWRFSFDAETGDMWVADVGQNAFEEVDLVRRGGNYGWNIMEGNHCFDSRGECDNAGLEPPVAEYGREGGCSITGGFVYRGGRLPSLQGAYVYGDFCSGRLWALRHDGEKVVESVSLADTSLRISSFGRDRQREIYVLSIDGRILRFVAANAD